MNKFGGLLILLAFVAAATTHAAAPEKPALSLEEVLSTVSSNLPGANKAELERAAARGLVNELAPQVQLITENTTNSTPAALTKGTVIEKSYAIIRLTGVESTTPGEFQEAIKGLSSTNKLKGLVLDLRFCTGRDYHAAAQVADRFIATQQPLFVSAGTNVQSTTKSNAITLPTVVLVNSQTIGASELLAAILRQAAGAVVIGSPTAGGARIFQDYPLSTGQKLRIAKADLELANGQSLTASGLTPDIVVTVPPDEERVLQEDPFRNSPRPGRRTNDLASATIATNRVMRRKFSEAELVRRHREGLDLQGMLETSEDTRETINDPALGRAVDFLKGLAVVQQFDKPRR